MPALYNPYRRISPAEPTAAKSEVVVHPDHDPKEFDRLLDEHHYLGSRCQAGDYLRQRIYLKGDLVGLLCWGACCHSLKDRDLHIGWNDRLRAERQKLVVQNRRFLLLKKKGEHPNLASQSLAAGLRALSGHWQKAFGYEPLAAETFTDIEAFEGTCYKASGWIPLGKTKGFSRHRADFFVENGRPKKLWFKALRPDAEKLLCAQELPPECQKGAHSDGHGVLPLSPAGRESLYECLRRFPDPRAPNTSFRLASILSVVVMAQMCGRTTVSDIVRFGKSLTQAQRRELGFPRKKDAEDFRKVPEYIAYRNLLGQINPEELAEHLSLWLQSQNGSLPGTLALDGKMLKNISGVISLVDAETGIPVSMAPMRHKEEGPDGELTCGKQALRTAGNLKGRTITGDALHADANTSRTITGQGGEYVLQVKANQPTLHKTAKRLTKSAPLFARTSSLDMDAS
jgi:hypothetical protein